MRNVAHPSPRPAKPDAPILSCHGSFWLKALPPLRVKRVALSQLARRGVVASWRRCVRLFSIHGSEALLKEPGVPRRLGSAGEQVFFDVAECGGDDVSDHLQ